MLERELILDRYRIIGKAGAGGYATVQHAYDTHLKRDVAIKCIRITRADVDAAKRTAAILKQIDPLAGTAASAIPVGSSRVIPAGGSTAARIRRESVRSVYGKAHRRTGVAFNGLEGTHASALPSEPSFLNKREERLAKGRGGRATTSARPSFDARVALAAQRADDEGATQPTEEPERISAPRDIPALVDMLPGAIKGAGETKINGVDSNALSISLDLAEFLDASEDEDDATARQVLAGLGGIPDLRSEGAGVSQDRPSFLDAMDADEAARWRGSGSSNADYRRNLALGGVADAAYDVAAQRPSVAAVQQWQQRAEAVQRHEQATRMRNVVRAGDMPDARSEALTPEELSQLGTVPGLEEARTAAHLNDANIVTVYDCVVEGDMAYVIMEYVEGKTLARLIRELGDEMTLDMVSAVFSSVSHALEVAHRANVLHLDIKPENVIVNKEGVVKVTDFGLSTLMDGSGQGKTGGGTIGYMPLEQMRRQPLDVRTDEWALASLTYEMLTGSNPFRAKTLPEAETAIEEAEIILPSRCWDGMDEDVDDVMFTALAPDADGRYETVTAFAQELMPMLANVKEGGKQLGRAVAVSPIVEEASTPDAPPAKGGFLGGLFGKGAKDAKGSHHMASSDPGHTPAPQPYEDDAESDVAPRSSHAPARASRAQERAQKVRQPRVPLIDRLGQDGAGVVMRIFACASAIMIAVVALMNFRVVFGSPGGMPDMTFGLFSTLPVAAWVALILFAVVGFLKPKIGFVVVYVAFAAALFVSQAYTAALLLVVGMGAWWWFFGRSSDAACTLVMMQPLLGSVGFAAIVPVVAGAVLDVKEALAAAAATAVSAMVFAALGSDSLANWEVLANFIVAVNPVIAGAAITNGLVETLSQAVTWSVAASWVLGAGAFSLFCVKGSKAFDIIGSVVCGALLIGGMLVLPYVLGMTNVMAPLSVAGTVVPVILGIGLAVANVTDRVRMAEGEW